LLLRKWLRLCPVPSRLMPHWQHLKLPQKQS